MNMELPGTRKSHSLVLGSLVCFLIALSLSPVLAGYCLAGGDLRKGRFQGQGDEPWNITARRMSYDDKRGLYEAEGDVVISRSDQALYARKASYNTKTGIAELEGDIRMETPGEILTGEKGVFDFRNQTGKIFHARLLLKDNRFRVRGDLMEKLGKDTYLVKGCHITTCDGPNPAWSITGSEVRVTVEKYGTVKNAVFRVRNAPVLYVPYMIFPAGNKRKTGLLLPGVGHSTRNGADVEVPFYWAVSNQVDATFYQRYLSKRGYMQGTEFRYVTGRNSKGVLLFDILSDRDKKGLNDSDDVGISPYPRTNRTRYWARARADQDLPAGFAARLNADYVSDQDYMNEFLAGGSGFKSRTDLGDESGRPVEERRSPIRTSALRVSRDGEAYSLQARGSYYQLPGNPARHRTDEPLGGVSFSLLPERIPVIPAFFSMESDYDYVWNEDEEKGHRLSVSPEIRIPLKFAPFMEVEPSIRYTLTPQRVDDGDGGTDTQSLKTYETGIQLSTSLDRIYDTDIGNAGKLKHRIRPIVSYTYRGFRNGSSPDPWFEPAAEQGRANRVTLAIENFLDARLEDDKGDVSYRQWVKFTLSQAYSIYEKRRDQPGVDKEPFEPLQGVLTVTPFPQCNFFADVRWDHYDHRFNYADLSLELTVDRSGDREDRFHLDYLYDRNNHENINLWVDVNLFYGFSAGGSLERDLDLNEGISNRYWVQYRRQCWGIKVGAEKDNGNTSVMIEFQLLGLGNVGVF
ncbi:MAG: hypothetical protein DRH37_09030 [Deltaproteobacteria bacterium]|nr:MAG: hypothetical protein DRH37_09030 [Deltaproteobacteria bacterium]